MDESVIKHTNSLPMDSGTGKKTIINHTTANILITNSHLSQTELQKDVRGLTWSL